MDNLKRNFHLFQVLMACVELGGGKDTPAALEERFGLDALNSMADSLRSSGLLEWLDAGVLAQLVRAFVLMENEIGFCRGSTSNVRILLDTLRRCDSTLADNLTDWAFVTAKNPYTPFGTCNAIRYQAKSASEYLALIEKRDAENDALDRFRHEQAQEMRRNRHEERVRQRKAAANDRHLIIESFANIPPKTRLELLTESANRPTYYPQSFAEVTKAEIEELSLPTRQILLDKLDRKRKGKWGELRCMLEKSVKLN